MARPAPAASDAPVDPPPTNFPGRSQGRELVPDGACLLCRQPLEACYATLRDCGHRFHRICIQDDWYGLVSSLKPVACAQCGIAISTRPPIPLEHIEAPRPHGRAYPYCDEHIWFQVHRRLRALRDEETEQICKGAPDRHNPDVDRAELAPFRRISNFFEMVNACWLCHMLLGNEFWVKLDGCSHCFHAGCIVDFFQVRCTPKCPLCGHAQILPTTLYYDEPVCNPTKKCYIWEIPLADVWHGVSYKFRRRIENTDITRSDGEAEGPEPTPQELRSVRGEPILFENLARRGSSLLW